VFATATAATLCPRRCSVCTAHRCSDVGCFGLRVPQERSGAVSREHAQVDVPLFADAPSRRRGPVEPSFGVNPKKIAKWRPEGNRRMSVTSATSAVAVMAGRYIM
jgi:hypothetical protein